MPKLRARAHTHKKTARGCPFQALSIGEWVRLVWTLLRLNFPVVHILHSLHSARK
jgi:hypothetical protein